MANHIVLYEPLIPANTGNIARTCAGTNTTLHLIEPLGFSTEDKYLKRAGLDYWNDVSIHYHKNLEAFMDEVEDSPLYLISKFAEKVYADVDYSDTSKDHYFLFGKETKGLPENFMKKHKEKCFRIPMDDTHIRALNLANSANILIYEALRQQHFPGLERVHTYDNDKLK